MTNFKETILNLDAQYHLGIGKTMGWDNPASDTDMSGDDMNVNLQSVFKLPITYLPEETIRPLSSTVSSDLELVGSYVSQDDKEDKWGMYDYLLKPTHDFGSNMIPEWNAQFTTHVPFLEESQRILQRFPQYLETPENVPPKEDETAYVFDQEKCKKIMEIWQDTKEDPDFLEKYCYIEWDMVKYLNKSPHFLQSMSIINMAAPVMSFIIPIVFLIFPFIILKIQNVPINFSMYIQVLKDIARHHFIGKAITSIQSLSWDKIIYLLITLALYCLQIYQNVNLCYRFYRNIHLINSHLTDMREYIRYSIHSMEKFAAISEDLSNYRDFNIVTQQQCDVLREFYQELLPIRPFQPGFSKIVEIGYLLKCFYELHSNKSLETSLRYSMGFAGYINNLSGIHENMVKEKIAIARFNRSTDSPDITRIKKQYYPAYVDTDHVKNSFDLSNNVIITGPNASGKTTMLKATTINIIFTQQFGVGFYETCAMTPYTHIHSYLNIPDTSGRDSLFQAESRRCKEIIDIIQTPYPENPPEHPLRPARHFCIFDELYSGTNPTEATKSAYAFLMYLSKFSNVDFILTTHYVSICKKLEKKMEKCENIKKIGNYKMDVIENPETGKVKYTYLMKRGISKIQGAVLILEEMCYPKEIINEMRKITV